MAGGILCRPAADSRIRSIASLVAATAVAGNAGRPELAGSATLGGSPRSAVRHRLAYFRTLVAVHQHASVRPYPGIAGCAGCAAAGDFLEWLLRCCAGPMGALVYRHETGLEDLQLYLLLAAGRTGASDVFWRLPLDCQWLCTYRRSNSRLGALDRRLRHLRHRCGDRRVWGRPDSEPPMAACGLAGLAAGPGRALAAGVHVKQRAPAGLVAAAECASGRKIRPRLDGCQPRPAGTTARGRPRAVGHHP